MPARWLPDDDDWQAPVAAPSDTDRPPDLPPARSSGGPPPIMCPCGTLVPYEEAALVWIAAPLGLCCVRTHPGPCVDLAEGHVGGRRRERPVTKQERAANAASSNSRRT